MNRRSIGSALVAAVAFLVGNPSQAQDIPRTANGKPDFSGIYTPPATINATGPRGNLIFNADKMAPVKPGAESLLYRLRTGDVRLDEPRAACLPSGFPSGMLYILPIQIVQNPNHIVIIPELQRAARIIPTDGRPHREGIEPTYYGDSVGRWDGDALIIETVNFKPWILDDYHYTDPTKSRWHTDALKTTERLQRVGDKLRYRITIDDSKIFERPWSQDFELTLRPDWEKLGLLEYVCEENNRCPGGKCREVAAVKRWCVLVAVVIMAGVMARVETQAQTPAPRPASTVQQLMQAILFPNANVIFATESDDPAAVPRDAKPSASTNPLSGLYGGWQAVENSSLALLESADLLNLSGRACADGRPVPVDESQWKAAVEAMRESARATAAAARARSQEQISEANAQLADSCSGCHRIYRRAKNHCSR